MKNEISRRRSAPKTHRLGQHQLVDEEVLYRIIHAAEISDKDTVCEIGAGNGVLTRELCKSARKVISFEVDPQRFREVLKALGNHPNLTLFNLDAFKATMPNFDKFVSNLPYSRSREAIEWLASTKGLHMAIIMLQDEFAAKLFARPGDDQYRSVSVIAGYCFTIERLFTVSKTAFKPQPKIKSVVLKLVPMRSLNGETIAALNTLFSFRNKKVSSVIRRLGILAESGATQTDDRRIDQLEPYELVELAQRVVPNDLRSR